MENVMILTPDMARNYKKFKDRPSAMERVSELFVKLAREGSDVMTEAEEREMIEAIKNGFEELRLAKEGKIKLKTLDEFLNEIQN